MRTNRVQKRGIAALLPASPAPTSPHTAAKSSPKLSFFSSLLFDKKVHSIIYRGLLDRVSLRHMCHAPISGAEALRKNEGVGALSPGSRGTGGL